MLGLIWNSENDIFKFNISTQIPAKVRKCQVLAGIAKIFDALEFLGPVLTVVKLIM